MSNSFVLLYRPCANRLEQVVVRYDTIRIICVWAGYSLVFLFRIGRVPQLVLLAPCACSITTVSVFSIPFLVVLSHKFWFLAYSQCIPSSIATTTASGTTAMSGTTTAPTATTSVATTPTTTTASSTTAGAPAASCSVAPASAGKLQFAGVNIAGFDFGCGADGTCNPTGAWPPLTQYYGMDGAGQMQHFVDDDGYNAFRLPVGWQFLTNGALGGDIDEDNWAEYDALVQACLATGAHCIIDVHNYARWNGEVSDELTSCHVKLGRYTDSEW